MELNEIYINVLFLLVLLTSLLIRKSVSQVQVVEVPSYWWMFVFGAFAVYCFANCPIPWGTWADRHSYAWYVICARQGIYSFEESLPDKGFVFWIKWTSKIVDFQGWFYLTACVYVGNYMCAAWRFTRRYSYVLFLMMLCCFQYYAYATNTIRAGFAASFIILGLSFCNDLKKLTICLIIAVLCHKSMIIPVSAILLAWNFRRTNLFLLGWFLCFFVSYVWGEGIQERFSFLISETRTGYLTVDAAHTAYKIGFRWDFLTYSMLPIILGWYYIFTLNFKNEFYEFLYRMYLTANGFWILVIRAAFSDRFAYLSWFLFPILLVYPLLSKQLYRDAKDQAKMITLVMIGEFAFNFLMFLLYGGSFFGFKFF